MSIPVEIDDLVDAVADYGWAYLVTVRDDSTPHIVAVEPAWSDGAARFGAGRSTAHNVGTRPSVTICYPPVDRGGYSLIVDGTAAVDGDLVVFTPTGAVLHRPAPGTGSNPVTGCASDCAPVAPRTSP